MTSTHTETSPLRAAREWRGISLAEAARTSGLSMTQAEALEDGEMQEFATTEEMIAAAVVYGSSLGIGRDEATAPLDRTIAAADAATLAPVDTPTVATPPVAAFSQAVREKSVAIQERSQADTPLTLEPLSFDMPSQAIPVVDSAANPVPSAGELTPEQTGAIELPGAVTGSPFEPTGMTGELPALPRGAFEAAANGPQLSDNPTVRAAMQLDPGWQRALEQSQSELDAWAATRPGGAAAAISRRSMAVTEKVLGPQRAERLAVSISRASLSTRRQIAELRTRMNRSEHATLIVAVSVGVLLMALLMAVASVIGGDEPKQSVPVSKPTQPAPKQAAAPAPQSKQADKPKPILKPAQLQLQILNAGSKSGYANEVADKLEGLGYKIADVGNSDTAYKTAVILHSEGLNREALRLSKQSGITTTDVLPETKGQKKMMVILV